MLGSISATDLNLSDFFKDTSLQCKRTDVKKSVRKKFLFWRVWWRRRIKGSKKRTQLTTKWNKGRKVLK